MTIIGLIKKDTRSLDYTSYPDASRPTIPAPSLALLTSVPEGNRGKLSIL